MLGRSCFRVDGLSRTRTASPAYRRHGESELSRLMNPRKKLVGVFLTDEWYFVYYSNPRTLELHNDHRSQTAHRSLRGPLVSLREPMRPTRVSGC